MSGQDADFAQKILKLRAQRLAAARENAVETPDGQAALCVRLAGEIYALPLDCLVEVLPLKQTTPVPGQSRHLLGVTNVRGEIHPVLNLHDMLGFPEPGKDDPQSVVFIRRAGRDIGLRVDEVLRIRFVASQDLTLPQKSANGLPQRYIAGITADTVILLDPLQILAVDALKDRRSDYARVT